MKIYFYFLKVIDMGKYKNFKQNKNLRELKNKKECLICQIKFQKNLIFYMLI